MELQHSEEKTCGICHEERRYLKVLPCRHKFCEYCLQQIIINHRYELFPCPMCRKSTPVPEGGASGFPIHTVGLVDTDVDVAARAFPSAPMDTCGTCEADLDQMLFSCTSCKAVVCEWCQDDHLRLNHPLVLLRSRGRDAAQSQDLLKSTRCLKHGEHDLTHFCLSCKELLCDHCLQLTHRRHKVEDLPQAAQRARQRLKIVNERVDPLLKHLQWVHDDIKSCLDTLKQEEARLERQIRQRADKIRKKATELETAAIVSLHSTAREVERQYTDDLQNVVTKLSGMRAKQRHVGSLLESGLDACLVRMEPSAKDSVRRKSHLNKFTQGLPQNVFRIHDRSNGSFDSLGTVMDKYIGHHRMDKATRKVPDLE